MDRLQEVINYVCKDGTENEKLLLPSIREFVFLEKRLDELKKLPFIQVHNKDSTKQRATPAAKQYKELLQQYNNLTKILAYASGKQEGADIESPLRKWVKNRVCDE